MCLDSTKQIYVIFTPLARSNDEGIGYEALVNSALEVSIERFDNRSFVNVPMPINTFLRQARRSGEIQYSRQGLWKLTEKGLRTYKYLLTRELIPYWENRDSDTVAQVNEWEAEGRRVSSVEPAEEMA